MSVILSLVAALMGMSASAHPHLRLTNYDPASCIEEGEQNINCDEDPTVTAVGYRWDEGRDYWTPDRPFGIAASHEAFLGCTARVRWGWVQSDFLILDTGGDVGLSNRDGGPTNLQIDIMGDYPVYEWNIPPESWLMDCSTAYRNTPTAVGQRARVLLEAKIR